MAVAEKIKRKLKLRPLPRPVYIAICTFPAVLTILFYVLRTNTRVMDWASLRVAAPIRGFLGLITSIFPFSVMEILIAAAVIGGIWFIVRTIKLTIRKHGARLKTLSRRVLHLAVVVLYIWGLFCWLWNTGYFAQGFAERNGIISREAAVEELIAVTEMFVARANELSQEVDRNEDGRLYANRREVFAQSLDVFHGISNEFPELGGRIFRPKPMIFSWLMSRTGYAGIYFALTGEANVNTQLPMSTMPATIAHEHAHQLGVFSEDEANFVAIMASAQSGILIYEYSGYFFGLIHLMRALNNIHSELWVEMWDTFSPELQRDWRDNREFWQLQRTVDTGIGLVDTVLTAVTETLRDAVDTTYDRFLRANDQELGLQSYGAVVDLLIAYFLPV
ncbi:MAG: DUF3810 domain-containing protein [Oscillospiraceae bacterium]|nr:DUF3810 domain-containing protein [Oscillospiraceae bacterium]